MPMNPEWLPVLALLLAGLFAGVVAARLFFTGDRGKATNLATAAIAMIVFAFALGQLPSKRIQVPEKPVPLTPAAMSLPRTIGSDGEETDTTSASLVLGGVLLRVVADNRYVLSVDGRRFLELESSPAGLRVTCDVADSNGQPAARIREDRFGSSLAYGVNLGGSNHILLLHKEGSVLFRIRYST